MEFESGEDFHPVFVACERILARGFEFPIQGEIRPDTRKNNSSIGKSDGKLQSPNEKAVVWGESDVDCLKKSCTLDV
jgi:hypothetical protein